MRRPLRWSFNLAAFASAALFVALCVLWVRSYWVCDTWTWEGPGGRTTWYTSRGQLAHARWVLTASTEPVDSEFVLHERMSPIPLSRLRPRVTVGGWGRAWGRAGFADWTGAEWGSSQRVRLVPFYAVALLFSLPPLAWLALRTRRLYARRRRRIGLCLRCGYDLTGNTSGRCSECGEKIEPVSAERRVTA